MSGRKGMVHYRVELKQEAVRLVMEERRTYTEVATRLAIRKAARIKAWLRMENALLKKFHTELRGLRPVVRNIGQSTTTKQNSK